MAKLSKKDMEELREFCSLGCEFSGTAETVREIADEVLQENGCHSCQCDDATVIDLDEDVVCTVEDFAREFWEKAVEKILMLWKHKEGKLRLEGDENETDRC